MPIWSINNTSMHNFSSTKQTIRRMLAGIRNTARGLVAIRRAQRLQTALYADVQDVPAAEWEAYSNWIKKLCAAREYTEEYTESWLNHRYRLYFTVEWLMRYAQPCLQQPIAVELGTASIVSDILQKEFPTYRWLNTDFDLRLPWPYESQSADLIVCTEILEHVSDLPDDLNDTFYMSGLRAVLQESYHVLKPGGILFVTTPNATSVLHNQLVLWGFPPWLFRLHVREYTPTEIITELTGVGFEIVTWRTIHCLTVDYGVDYTGLFQLLLSYGYSTENRGDDTFIIARRSHRNDSDLFC